MMGTRLRLHHLLAAGFDGNSSFEDDARSIWGPAGEGALNGKSAHHAPAFLRQAFSLQILNAPSHLSTYTLLPSSFAFALYHFRTLRRGTAY